MTCSCALRCTKQAYNDLLSRYISLCRQVAALKDEIDDLEEPEQLCEERQFLGSIYPYIDTLTTEYKIKARMLFQKMLYRYAFDPEFPINIQSVSDPKSLNKIRMFKDCEKEFYENFISFLSLMQPDVKLQFRIDLMHKLQRITDEKEKENTNN